MSTPSTSRSISPPLPRDMLALSGPFRSLSPTHLVQIQHPIPNHPHLHIHTIRSTMTPLIGSGDSNESGGYDDDAAPHSSISAQILAPFLNGPMPSTFTATPPHQNTAVSTNGFNRGASARMNALGSSSRSSSVRANRRRRSNEDNSLVVEYLELIGDGHVDAERLGKIRLLAGERGVPSQLRRYVWPLLLSQSIRQDQQGDTQEDFEEKLSKISKRIRGELSRYHRRKNRRALPSLPAATPSTQNSTPHQESSFPSTMSSTPSSLSSSPLHPLFLDDAPLDLAVESTIISFLASNPDVEYSPGMVYLALTLATYIFQPPIIHSIPYFDDPNILLHDAFSGALALFGQLPSSFPMRASRQNSVASLTSTLAHTEASKFPATHRISQFLSAFRSVMPELASFFDDEGIGGWGDDWVGGWVGWFCAKELSDPVNDEAKARLWDVYFSFPPVVSVDCMDVPRGPGEELHVYVCIALLKSCADAFEVMEQSEIRTLLQQLPPVDDVEGILKEARRIKEKVLLVEKEEEEGYLARKSNNPSRSGSDKSS